jgi:hypothetical protein
MEIFPWHGSCAPAGLIGWNPRNAFLVDHDYASHFHGKVDRNRFLTHT